METKELNKRLEELIFSINSLKIEDFRYAQVNSIILDIFPEFEKKCTTNTGEA